MCQGRKKPARVVYSNMGVLSPPYALRIWFLSGQPLWVTYRDLPSDLCLVVCFSFFHYLATPEQWEKKEGDDVTWGPLPLKLRGAQFGKAAEEQGQQKQSGASAL